MTNVVPIDSHFKLRASETLTRIMSKRSAINLSYNKWKASDTKKNGKILTTYRKLELATQQIIKKNINQYEVKEVNLYNSKFPPFVDTPGILDRESSKEQQVVKVKDLIRNNDYDLIISTDGSTLKEGSDSLGPSGAAAVVFGREDTESEVNVITSNLGSLSHNYEAELIGLNLGLNFLQQEEIKNNKILFVSDCVPAIEATFTNKISKDYNIIIMSNKHILHHLKSVGQNS